MPPFPAVGLDAARLVPFLLVFGLMLGIMLWASRRTRTVSDFLVAGNGVNAWQNALAMAGDFVAAAGLLGITGLIALFGAYGMVFAVELRSPATTTWSWGYFARSCLSRLSVLTVWRPRMSKSVRVSPTRRWCDVTTKDAWLPLLAFSRTHGTSESRSPFGSVMRNRPEADFS